MKDQSTTCVQLTFLDLLNATGSVGSEAGRMLCVLLAGAMTDLYGQDPRRASLSVPPAVSCPETTPDTSPPILSAWSGPPVPQCCLANRSPVRKCSERLQAALESALADRLHGLGSTIYQIAWKPHVTPLGRQISRQRASARRISDSGPSSVPSGWPTPTTRDWKDGGNPNVNVELNGLLGRVVWLTGWPTPRASENVQTNLDEIAETGSSWLGQNRGATVSTMAQMAKGCPARFTASGQMLTGCSAGMGNGGQLNPRFSGWLMGYPDAWCRAALSCQLPIRSRKAEKMPAA